MFLSIFSIKIPFNKMVVGDCGCYCCFYCNVVSWKNEKLVNLDWFSLCGYAGVEMGVSAMKCRNPEGRVS